MTQQQGKHFGESYPVLLDPKVLEETMIKAQLGSNVVSGEQLTFPKPDAHLDVQAALCTFLQRYHVGAVTFWKSPTRGDQEDSTDLLRRPRPADPHQRQRQRDDSDLAHQGNPLHALRNHKH